MTNNIKIGGLIYNVNYCEELFTEQNFKMFGEIDYEKLVINICQKYPRQRQSQTILHEIIHGVNDHIGADQNENSVELFTNVLYSTIIDNKEFFKEMIDNGSRKPNK